MLGLKFKWRWMWNHDVYHDMFHPGILFGVILDKFDPRPMFQHDTEPYEVIRYAYIGFGLFYLTITHHTPIPIEETENDAT